MNNNQDSKYTCFCVFHHNPFQRGNEGGEDGSLILQQLLYKYPSNIPDRSMEHLLSVLISLYTFTSLSLEGKKLDFLSWSNSKVAIQTYAKQDGSLLFFVLRVPSIYSDFSISRALEHLKRGLFFVLGTDGFEANEILQKYLEDNGPKICSVIVPLSSPDPLPFSFTNLPNAEWHRPNVATVLTEVTLMQTYPEVWGIVCFSYGLLLASHSPIDIIRFFDFVTTDAKRTKVYLTKEDRKYLLEFPGSISEIPESDVIETLLLKFQHESVVFYLLADPNIPQEVYEKIHETLTRAMPEILSVSNEAKKPQFPPNTLVYNSVLNILNAGPSSDDFQNMAINAHDLFTREENLRDIVMHNAREFSVCMNIIKVEHYASVSGNSKLSMKEMYDMALKEIPDLVSYLQSLHFPQES
ncbi:hypothetical protein TRFO_13161 [Tritrichomonas foetus]|uniref:Uncharacterized protein n=1 Tax=Tritrichomonas foetus TaxID=1144522 RepID=A0A1J4KZ83_9EUKA|nr:hypothetical protein TRFO_13161 [Tritrichomonas foetus]|eukprot:OHT16563.1 hypothetical protein TRFO_13161 [Tritrichomonas foetus]